MAHRWFICGEVVEFQQTIPHRFSQPATWVSFDRLSKYLARLGLGMLPRFQQGKPQVGQGILIQLMLRIPASELSQRIDGGVPISL